jgi:hypothetical protein
MGRLECEDHRRHFILALEPRELSARQGKRTTEPGQFFLSIGSRQGQLDVSSEKLFVQKTRSRDFFKMDFLKSAVASAISKGPAFPFSFDDRVDIDNSIWTLHNGTKRVRPSSKRIARILR